MKKISYGKISIEMRTVDTKANRLVINIIFIKVGFSLSIPMYKIMQSGIKGVPTSITEQELSSNFKASCAVIEIRRLNRRVVMVKDGIVECVLSTIII